MPSFFYFTLLQMGDRVQTVQHISQVYVKWRYGGHSPNLRELQQRLREMRKTKVKGCDLYLIPLERNGKAILIQLVPELIP
ncbi:hypothetical protein C7B65_26210, partial [Phormidesmis priestleyi ULC007]